MRISFIPKDTLKHVKQGFEGTFLTKFDTIHKDLHNNLPKNLT